MFQSFIRHVWVVGLILSLQSASAFSLLGPTANGPDSYQESTIGYALPGDIGAPKNIGEEYRRNLPVMYYACDASFFDYFYTNGAMAVDQAFAVFNALTNVDNYNYTDQSATSLFPFDTVVGNSTAGFLDLGDVKSATMFAMLEQLGLAQPRRWTWALKDRFVVPGFTEPCPAGIEYIVIQRNFDPITWGPTNAVNNGTLGYFINELCKNDPPPESDAIEFGGSSFAVADGFPTGGFYTGLTWDDVGGLRYLLSSNNINTETPAPGSLLESTNNPSTLLTTSDLGALVTSAQTNSPAVLAALFPGVVANATSYFTNVTTPNVIIFTTNFPGEPFGTPPHIITVTNGFITSIVQRFLTTFANVVTNNYRTNSTATLLTTTFGAQPGAPFGSPFVTTTTTQTIKLTNTPTGDYFIIPAGSCGLDVVHDWQTITNFATNVISFAVNPDGSSITESLVTSFTNHIMEVRPCNFVTPSPGLYEGVGRIQYIRADFDSLIGQTWQPITNTYSMILITNSMAVKQTFQRIVTQPDFVFATADLDPGGEVLPLHFSFSRNVTFDQANINPGLAGPGTITTPSTITFNKYGPIFEQLPNVDTNAIDTDLTQIQIFGWGSFTGDTNNVTVYPVGTSIQNLADQLLIHILPATLPNGTHGSAYAPATFTTTGGSFELPYTWTIVLGSLPPGMALSTDGTLSGTPTQAGTFNFVVQLADSNGRAAQWSYSLVIQ